MGSEAVGRMRKQMKFQPYRCAGFWNKRGVKLFGACAVRFAAHCPLPTAH